MPTAKCSASSPSLTVPATQNTAPVHEFNCLFTHDIRRKSKRWQDGFLRFHTFNKRIMVFDVPRNLIGDTHWTDDELLQDGDEVILDRSGVLVQVADQIGKTETDLTGIRKSKNRISESSGPPSSLWLPSGGVSQAIQRTATSTRSAYLGTPLTSTRQPLQEKHRSLNALLGNNRAPIGKTAAIVQSPFEIRRQQEKSNVDDAERPPKRRKVSERSVGHLKKDATDAVEQRRESSPEKSHHRAKEQSLQNSLKEVIELSSDVEDHNTSMTNHQSSIAARPRPRTNSNRTGLNNDKTKQSRRDADASIGVTRLSIKAPDMKRGMLICLASEHATAQSDIAIQQSRLDDRLARIAERKSRGESNQKVSENRSSPVHSLGGGGEDVAVTRSSRTDGAGHPTIVANAENPLDDNSSADDDAFEVDTRIQPRKSRGEAYDLFGTDAARSVCDNDIALAAFQISAQNALPDGKGDPRMHRPPDAIPEMHQFPSTLELDQALVMQADESIIDRDVDRIQTESGMNTSGSLKSSRLDTIEKAVVDRQSISPAYRSLSDQAKHPAQDPWSREAFDLFKWRPPGWDEEKWCNSAG